MLSGGIAATSPMPDQTSPHHYSGRGVDEGVEEVLRLVKWEGTQGKAATVFESR